MGPRKSVTVHLEIGTEGQIFVSTECTSEDLAALSLASAFY